MRKLLLTFTAMLFCSISALAQLPTATQPEGSGTEATPYLISNASEFVWIANNNNYDVYFKQDADIIFGDLGTLTEAIIPTFKGIYDGDGHTITYQANFNGATTDGKYGLFGSVDGGRVNVSESYRPEYVSYDAVIRNLNVNANITLVGRAANMNVALLCGKLGTRGVIEYCNVSGDINSAVNSETGGGTDAGLVAGQCLGSISYCIASGNVTGIGYVGGIVGQLGDVWERQENPGSIKACSFTGAVNSDRPVNNDTGREGSFGGGICGMSSNNSTIEFCVANADITAEKACNGISSTTVYSQADRIQVGTTDVTNSYAGGNINEDLVDGSTITNSNGETTPLYYEGQMPAQDIVDELNDAIPEEEQDKFYFDVINGEVVLIIGQRACKTPSNLRVTPHYTSADLAWDAPAGATRFEVTITGGNIITQTGAIVQVVNGTTYRVTGVGASETPYQVTVRTMCGDNFYSDGISTAFNSTCPNINGLTVNNITHETATATWTSTESTTFTVRLYAGNDINSTPISTTNITESQTQASINLPSLAAATQYTIEVVASCGTNVDVEANHSIQTFTTKPVNFETAQSGNFNDPNTWEGNVVPSGNVANIIINTGHRVSVSHNLVITGTYKIVDNNGVLEITQQGQLINTTGTNVLGIVEIVTPQKSLQAWTFIGAPFQTGYKLGCILPESHDVSVKKYDYKDGNATPGWSDSWAHIGTAMKAGEGYFAYPFYNGVIDFTTYGDVGTYADRSNGYTSTNTVTSLNNEDVTVTETIAQSNNGYWMALSNPYPAKLHVNAFKGANNLQGNCVYVFRGGSFDIPATDINMTEGFFVNVGSAGQKSITFTKEQLSYNYQPSTGAKASANEFIKLTLINGDKKVRAYLAHNEEAEQGYDIFDANKMFAPTEIAEPYFVTDGIALMKEEFAELPYYATMNVRSFADDTVSFVVENIPEGLSVSIIDGENIIDMVEGGVYTTEILTGENADRFKVLIKKSVSISDVEELEVNITNNNRHISIETTETDLQVEVYNALGQKVLSTKDRNFTLNQVSAGAYLIKAFNNKASKTQKIVVE